MMGVFLIIFYLFQIDLQSLILLKNSRFPLGIHKPKVSPSFLFPQESPVFPLHFRETPHNTMLLNYEFALIIE